jgi:hypothetical protein
MVATDLDFLDNNVGIGSRGSVFDDSAVVVSSIL